MKQVLQGLEIREGIVEAVGVVEPERLDLAVVEQFPDDLVGLLEHRRIFHAHRGEAVDVEEASVVDLLDGHAPRREPVALHLQQPVHRVEARGLPGVTVELLHRRKETFSDGARAFHQARETSFPHVVLSRAASSLLRVSLAAGGQVDDSGDDALELLPPLVVLGQVDFRQRRRQHGRDGFGGQREALLAVGERHATAFHRHAELSALEHAAVGVSEDR